MNVPRQVMLSSIGLLILRVGMGGYMLTHGWGKLQMLLNSQAEMIGDPIGIGSRATLILLVLAEFVCALLVMAGLLTRLAAVPLVIAMAVAVLVGHAGDPWTMGQAYQLFMAGETESPFGKQPALMFLIGFLPLIFTGPGRLSLDALLGGFILRKRNVRD